MNAEAVIALVAVVVSVVAARYAASQARSANRAAGAAVDQGASARDQATAAREQVAAAGDQVSAAQRQNELQEQARRDAAAPPATQVTVTCDGPFGPVDPLTDAVFFEEFRHQSAAAVGNLHRVERSIDKLTAAVTKGVQRR